jgi:GTPase SAR1 family protein
MITLICGLAGSGKTWLMARMLKREWKRGQKDGLMICANFPLCFPKNNERVKRFWTLSDTYRLHNGIIALDEAQKLLDARHWASLPTQFADLICQHRHSHLDIYTTTQDLGQIDIQLRRNIHELFTCQTIFRFPRNERVSPLIQWIRVTKQVRRFDVATNYIAWNRSGRVKWYFISYLWTKKLYETYAKTMLSKYLCKTIYKDKKWVTVIANRSLVASGKVRGF